MRYGEWFLEGLAGVVVGLLGDGGKEATGIEWLGEAAVCFYPTAALPQVMGGGEQNDG